MQKRSFALFSVLAAIVLIAAACGQKSGASTSMTGSAPQSLASDSGTGFNILHNLGLYIEKDGSLVYKEALTLGEKLSIIGEQQKKTIVNSTAVREYFPVRRETGQEGWARSEYVIAGSTLGVTIQEEAMIYSQPKNEAATVNVLPKLCILALAPNSETGNFVMATTVEPENDLLKQNIYLRKEAVSTAADDVSCTILYTLALESKNAKQRETFLKSAQTDYPSSAFAPLVTRYLEALTLPDAGKSTETYEAAMTATDNNVNVRTIPDEEFGTVIGTLKLDATVETTNKTTDTYTIEETTANWYKIKSPTGWVFGGFLKDSEESGSGEEAPSGEG